MIGHYIIKHSNILEDQGLLICGGAAPYLAKYRNISVELATDVLLSWIENYDELSKKFSWR